MCILNLSKTLMYDFHYHNDKTNKKVIGKLKDEACSIPVNEFIGLRSKMYSHIKDDDKGCKITKGIKKNVIRKNDKHKDYINVLSNNKQLHHKLRTIRSNNPQLGSYEQNKVSLSCFDNKRYIHEDGVTSYAYGHYKIQK